MEKKLYKKLDDDVLEKLHDAELEILSEIDRICKKHNLNYFLVGGTLLGAERHKGFIPWDDDLDVGMVREDYEKFIDYALDELDDKFFIHCDKTDKHYWLPFVKIKKNNTTFVEALLEGKESIHSGIFVDIFPLDTTGSNYTINRIKGLIVRNIADCLLIKEKKILMKEARHSGLCFLLCLFTKKRLLKMQEHIINFYNKKDYYVAWVGTYHIKKEMLKIDDVFPLRDISFEGRKCKCYRNYKLYLSNIYGDYMKLPPEEERYNHAVFNISFTKGDNIKVKDVR